MTLVMTLEAECGSREWSWWVGDGAWWLMVEGFGLVETYWPGEGERLATDIAADTEHARSALSRARGEV